MKIVVLMKQTFDTEARIELDGSGAIIHKGIKKIMNPNDEFAVEEAIRIKEKIGGDVTVVSLGTEDTVEALRQALAMGADRAVLLSDPVLFDGDGFSSATAIAAAVKQLDYDLLLSGWVAIDDGAAQVAIRVSDILAIPQITMVTKLTIGDGKVVGAKEMDGADVTVEVPLPALITVKKGINEPRYPGMKGIMSAKKKEIKRVTAADLGLPAEETGSKGARIETTKIFLSPKRQNGKVISGDDAKAAAGQLAAWFHDEIKII